MHPKLLNLLLNVKESLKRADQDVSDTCVTWSLRGFVLRGIIAFSENSVFTAAARFMSNGKTLHLNTADVL